MKGWWSSDALGSSYGNTLRNSWMACSVLVLGVFDDLEVDQPEIVAHRDLPAVAHDVETSVVTRNQPAIGIRKFDAKVGIRRRFSRDVRSRRWGLRRLWTFFVRLVRQSVEFRPLVEQDT